MTARTARQPKKAASRTAVPVRTAWFVGLLAVLGIVAYVNSFDVPFVFDDFVSIQNNPAVVLREINWNPLAGRPLLYLTFIANYIWSEQEVWSYHLVNLILHLINGVLVFFIGLRIFDRVSEDRRRNRISAFIAAAFFLLHPVQTDAVTYVSSRSELLSLLFYLTAFLWFIKMPETSIGFVSALQIAIPFLLALSAKETAISLLAVLFLYDFIFLSSGAFRPMLARWRFYGTFVLAGLVVSYYLVTVTLRQALSSQAVGHLPTWHYFLTQTRVIVRYIYLTFVPVGLNMDYDFKASTSLLDLRALSSGLFIIAIIALGWLLRKRAPVVSFSIFWFFLTLAPTSSIVPLGDVIYDRRLYLPLAGASLAIPILFYRVSPRAVPVVAGVVLTLLTAGTIARNHVWRDASRLYEDTAAKSPQKLRVRLALPWTYTRKGEIDKAIASARKGMEDMPPMYRTDFLDVIGNMSLQSGRYDDALDAFKETVRLHSEPEPRAIAYNNVGVTYLNKWAIVKARQNGMPVAEFVKSVGETLNPARDAFQKSVELNPKITWALDAYVNVSFELDSAQQLQATTLVDVERGERSFNNLYVLGKIAFLKEDWSAAEKYFESAEALKPTEKLLLFNHAYVFEKLKDPDRALEKYLAALRQDPLLVQAHYNLAMLYQSRGEIGKAISHLSEVRRSDPSNRLANLNLAKLYAGQGDKAAAKKHLETILKARQGDPDALQLWKQLGL